MVHGGEGGGGIQMRQSSRTDTEQNRQHSSCLTLLRLAPGFWKQWRVATRDKIKQKSRGALRSNNIYCSVHLCESELTSSNGSKPQLTKVHDAVNGTVSLRCQWTSCSFWYKRLPWLPLWNYTSVVAPPHSHSPDTSGLL